jgi:hypothetical protein
LGEKRAKEQPRYQGFEEGKAENRDGGRMWGRAWADRGLVGDVTAIEKGLKVVSGLNSHTPVFLTAWKSALSLC